MRMTLALGLRITFMANATRHVRFHILLHVVAWCWELLRPFARSLKVILNLSNSIFPPRVIFLILPADGNFDAF